VRHSRMSHGLGEELGSATGRLVQIIEEFTAKQGC
jgi:hypothetical protein